MFELNRLSTKPRRINVIGTSGSGKSTFARRLAQKLNYPYIEMDQVFWGPNWHWPSDDVFLGNLKDQLRGESWVLDGNYTRSVGIKWQRVEMVIWLDFSFPLTLFRAVTRAFGRALTKEELWPGTGNRESFRKSFLSKGSIILWTIKTHRPVRRKYETIIADPQYAHIHFVRLRSSREATQFLERISRSAD